MDADKISRRTIPTGNEPPKSKPKPPGAPDPTQVFTEQILPDTLPLKEEGKAPVKSAGIAKCVYFRDKESFVFLEELSKKHPRCTFSSIVQQLVEGFELCCKSSKDPRVIEVDIKVYL